MQYVSPLSFLPATSGDKLSPGELKLARHKLLAEFELTGAASIAVNGKELSRSDVLKLFDQLGQSGDVAFHALVASDTVLLYFLDKHALHPGDKFSIPEEKVTPEFIEWISPYFSWAFEKATIRIFKDVCPEEFETLIVNPHYMTAGAEWAAWNSVEKFLHMRFSEFSEINNAKYHSALQVQKFAGYNFAWLLCNVPPERFQPELNDYAFELMRMAIKEFNTGKRDSAFEILGYARSLKVSEDTMQSLLAKEAEMQKIVKTKTRSDSNQSLWWVLRVALFAVYIIAQLSRGCNSSHNY